MVSGIDEGKSHAKREKKQMRFVNQVGVTDASSKTRQ